MLSCCTKQRQRELLQCALLLCTWLACRRLHPDLSTAHQQTVTTDHDVEFVCHVPLPASQGATKRFLKVAELKQPKPPQEEVLDNMLAAFHQTLTGIEALRVLAGAGANTKDTPLRVTDYVPSDTDVGGWFDDVSRAKRAYAMSKPTQQVKAPR